MSFVKKTSAAIISFLCILNTSQATAQSLQSGTYSDVDFGVMDVSCVSLTSCIATYDEGEGFIYLTRSEQEGVFSGYWAEPENSEPCDAARQFENIKTASWGKVELQVDASGRSWTGMSGQCDGVLDWPFNGANGQETDWFVEANLISILFHELGHALIDVLDLPVLGQEEAAVDVLTVLLIDELFDEDDAVEMAYEVALGYIGGENGDPANEEDESEPAFWDVHGTGDQRYYNTVCLFYGSEPDLRKEFAEEMELPKARAEKCEAEYNLAHASWGPILDRISGEGDSLQMVSTGNDATIRIVTKAVAELNLVLELPVQVSVRVTTCGQPAAFYDPDKREIIFCWEYTAYLQKLTDRGYFQGADTGTWKMSGANTADY